MKVGQLLAIALMVGIAGALITPAAIFGLRLADTWTAANTDQLLGGMLGICGGSLAIVAMLVGAGMFARLSGWQKPRMERPPELKVIEGDWRELPAPAPTPPWGMTGGGNFELLPPPKQDQRYHMESPNLTIGK